MKKVLLGICTFMILVCSSVYAKDYEAVYTKAAEISVALETADNVQELLGEAVILMVENDILSDLEKKGETECAIELKASADEALAASAASADDEKEKAIAFCDKLMAVQEIFPAEATAIKLTAESQAVPVAELEHYALAVNNSQLSDTPIVVTVEFWGDDAAVELKDVVKFDGKEATTFSSLSRSMVADNNVFNFTTPKGCKSVKVYVDSGAVSASVAVTNEVINNGSVVRVTKQGTFGWYTATNDIQDADKDCFKYASKVTTQIKQSLLLKAGSVYRLKFKAAISGTGNYSYPYFNIVSNTESNISMPTTQSWENLTVSSSQEPTASEWKEYMAYFIAGNSPSDNGLVQITIYPRGYARTDGYNYYDDFSVEEVDEGTYIWYVNDDEISVSAKEKATKIRYHYVQEEAGKTYMLICAKYEDNRLSSAEIIEAGKDLAVGESKEYDIEIEDATSKIFVWDVENLEPQRTLIEDYVITH